MQQLVQASARHQGLGKAWAGVVPCPGALPSADNGTSTERSGVAGVARALTRGRRSALAGMVTPGGTMLCSMALLLVAEHAAV